MIYNWATHIKGFLAIFAASGIGYTLWKHNPIDYLTHTSKEDKKIAKAETEVAIENSTIPEIQKPSKQKKRKKDKVKPPVVILQPQINTTNEPDLELSDIINAGLDATWGLSNDALKAAEYSETALGNIAEWFSDMVEKAIYNNVREYENPLADVKRGEESITRLTEDNESLNIFSNICTNGESQNADCRQITERLNAQTAITK